MAKLIKVQGAGGSPDGAAIQEAAAIIRSGGLVGFPTETVYGLAADALNRTAVARVFEVKARPLDSALILHLAGADEAPRYVRAIPAVARDLMRDFWPGPLTIILPRAELVPEITAGGRENIAMRVPDHPVARDLIRACGTALVGPSANKTGRPSPITAADVLAELDADIEAVLDAGPAPLGMESTVLDLTSSPPAILRPGSVTLEQLSPYLGPLVLKGGGVAPDAARAGAVRPRLVLADAVPGDEGARLAWSLALRELARGRRTGLLLTEEGVRFGRRLLGETGHAGAAGAAEDDTWPPGLVVASLGPSGDLRVPASRLYPALRLLERAGCDLIVAEPLPLHGLGLAIMNRLQKAASEVLRA